MMEILLSDVDFDDAEQISRHIEVPGMRNNPLCQVMLPYYDKLSLEQKEEIFRWTTEILEEVCMNPSINLLKATERHGTPYGFCGWTVIEKNEPPKPKANVELQVRQEDPKKTEPNTKRENWTLETVDTAPWIAASKALRMERERALQNLSNICRKEVYPTRYFGLLIVWVFFQVLRSWQYTQIISVRELAQS
jgi:hypothetical protein